MRRLLPVLLPLALAACKGEPHETADTGEPPLEPLFSFAVITDSHVSGPGENAQYLGDALAWIEGHVEERELAFFLVLGDIAWGNGLSMTKELLDGVSIPYVPITGDNEVHAGGDQPFWDTFSPQYDLLATELDDFEVAAMPVTEPVSGGARYFTNPTFTHEGVHFVGCDWSQRGIDGIEGEQADLHDFPGGTWPWLTDTLDGLDPALPDGVILFSHEPMHWSPGGFETSEWEVVAPALQAHDEMLYAAFGGHYHVDFEQDLQEEAGYMLYITSATWQVETTVRVVEVSGNGERFAYAHEIVDAAP